MESLKSNSQERVASVATNARQRKEKLHDIFSDTSFISTDQLQNQLDKDEFQEDKSMAAFWVLNNQFQKFINWKCFLDYDSEMTEKIFAKYTRIKVKQFRKTLLLHMGNVKKSVGERTRHKRHGTKPDEHITSSSSSTHITQVVDADIRPVNDQVPSAEVHLTAQHNVLANDQQHTDQSEPSYDTYLLEKGDSNTTHDSTNMSHRGGEIDQDAEQDQVKSPLLKAEFLKTNVIIDKEVYNELSNRFLQLEKHCISLEISIQQKEESFQSNEPFTPHYLPKVGESVFVRPNHVIASGSFRNSSKESWIPTGKMFTDCTTKVDSEPPNGSNEDITNPYECNHTLNVSADPAAVAAPRAVDPAGSPSSTTIDQDVSFASTSPTTQEIQSQVTHQGAEEQIHGHQNA
uniref:Uncharacterized protein n=1 Tax=Tanacetum cinerariifolium TaxID=118510 RepID=A0A6L2JNU2_TANCI|nr:hypothetical protein [Tanacetum cinerariifolium]